MSVAQLATDAGFVDGRTKIRSPTKYTLGKESYFKPEDKDFNCSLKKKHEHVVKNPKLNSHIFHM